jgi:lysozyme
MDLAIKLLKKHERLRLKPYLDSVGKLTIGYGRCLDTYGITEKEAYFMLMNNIMECIGSLIRIINGFNLISVNRQAVLINMIYNLGEDGFLKFRNTIACINEGNWDLASAEMLRSKWAGQVGNRAVELSKMLKEG